MNKTPAAETSSDRRQARGDRRGIGPDRRESGRLPFVAAVRHQVTPGRGGPAQVGQCTNLGLLGMKFLRPGSAHEPGWPTRTPMQVEFELPDGGHALTLWAEVVFDRPRCERLRATGLRFFQVPPDAEARLRSFLQREHAPALT